MTVQPGNDWGEEVTVPPGGATAYSDEALVAALGGVDGDRPVLVRGGDLHRSLGSPAGRGDTVRRLPIDLLRVAADSAEHRAVAHVVARRPGRLGWWWGPIVCVCNVDHVGAWDVAPRAHPNDGWLDVVEVSAAMPVRARAQARKRLRTGTHVPHPDISTRRAREVSFCFATPLAVWVDGIARGTARTLRVVVEPDAAVIYA